MKRYKIVPALGYDFLTPFYDFFSSIFGFGDRLKLKVIEALEVRDGEKILDVGCGTGSLAISLKKLYPTIEIFGVDPDPKILAIAYKKAAKENLDIEFVRSKAEKLPFLENTFDTVVSTLTFHHMPRQAKIEAAKEVRRVLKPNGRLHVLDFLKVKDGLWKIFHIFEEGKYLESNQELSEIFKNQGFEIKKIPTTSPWGIGIISGEKK